MCEDKKKTLFSINRLWMPWRRRTPSMTSLILTYRSFCVIHRSKDIFEGMQLTKLVKPMRWQDWATTPKFPSQPEEVAAEIKRQEFLLNRLHTQVQVREFDRPTAFHCVVRCVARDVFVGSLSHSFDQACNQGWAVAPQKKNIFKIMFGCQVQQQLATILPPSRK